MLLAIFAGIGLLLAAGIYGVVSYFRGAKTAKVDPLTVLRFE
ncbi:MAG TPA: hypothetical protein VFR84_07385 [Candidatus Angelobacter sp.]|nr:hypothetical protein [Candidatus Angelobacter sp.]